MRAVIKELTGKQGYMPAQPEWMTVFSL
jgi:hypothetical protein